MSKNKTLGQKIGGGICIIGAAAAAAPGISDFLAEIHFNSALHTTTIVAAGLLALSIIATASYAFQKPANQPIVHINMCIAAILTGVLAACYTAGQIMAYTHPIALSHTLSGMLMMKAGTAPHALVGTEVFGITLAFSAIGVVLFAIGMKMTGLLDKLPEELPIPYFESRIRQASSGKTQEVL